MLTKLSFHTDSIMLYKCKVTFFRTVAYIRLYMCIYILQCYSTVWEYGLTKPLHFIHNVNKHLFNTGGRYIQKTQKLELYQKTCVENSDKCESI